MQLTPFVDELQHQLLAAAEAAGEDGQRLAERLVPPLQSASRLMLLDALSAAAGEITSELAPGSVEVRLRGRDPEFVVTSPPGASADGSAVPEPVPTAPVPTLADAETATGADDAGTARVTLRLPEPLKARIEAAAGREGLSVNSFLVRTLSTAVEPGRQDRAATHPSPMGGQRFTGWAQS